MKISGKVIDKATGEPLPYVNVYFSNRAGKINRENYGTTTNEMGRYAFDWPADLFITASFVGYKKQTKMIPDDYSDNAQLNFELTPEATELSAVEIVAAPVKKSKFWITAGILSALASVWYISTRR